MSARRTFDVDPFNGYEYVDLGLPSGTLWGTANIGANNSTTAGLPFQFGDIHDCSNHNADISHYIYSNGTTYTKYNTSDGLTTLEASDDPANAIMGPYWFVPNYLDFSELIRNTNLSINSNFYQPRYTYTSKINGNSITLIGCGYKRDNAPNYNQMSVNYLTSNLYNSDKSKCYILFDDSPTGNPPYYTNGSSRFYGYQVRPVNRYFV